MIAVLAGVLVAALGFYAVIGGAVLAAALCLVVGVSLVVPGVRSMLRQAEEE